MRTVAIESLALGTSISLTSFDRHSTPRKSKSGTKLPRRKKRRADNSGKFCLGTTHFRDPERSVKNPGFFGDHFFRDHGKFLNAAGKKIYFLATRTCSRGKTCFDASKNLKKFERGIDSKSIRERDEMCEPIGTILRGEGGPPLKNRKNRAKSCGAISLVALAE